MPKDLPPDLGKILSFPRKPKGKSGRGGGGSGTAEIELALSLLSGSISALWVHLAVTKVIEPGIAEAFFAPLVAEVESKLERYDQSSREVVVAALGSLRQALETVRALKNRT